MRTKTVSVTAAVKRPRGRPVKCPGINLQSVADRAGISLSHLSNIMVGRYKPSLRVAGELARVWGEVTGRPVTIEGLAREFAKVQKRYRYGNSNGKNQNRKRKG